MRWEGRKKGGEGGRRESERSSYRIFFHQPTAQRKITRHANSQDLHFLSCSPLCRSHQPPTPTHPSKCMTPSTVVMTPGCTGPLLSTLNPASSDGGITAASAGSTAGADGEEVAEAAEEEAEADVVAEESVFSLAPELLVLLFALIAAATRALLILIAFCRAVIHTRMRLSLSAAKFSGLLRFGDTKEKAKWRGRPANTPAHISHTY